MKLYVRIVQAFFLMALTILLVVPSQRVIAQGAQSDRQRQLEAAGRARGAGLTATDPRWVVTNIITVALSVIGIIIFCFMFYAGFIWLTAAGDDEKINHAKNIIKGSIIGLFIILISLSLTTYVLSTANEATGRRVEDVIVYDTGLSNESPVVIIARIIQILVGLFSVILFCLTFYAGFIWLTAAGDDEKVNHAKEIIQTTVVGLLIALIAYSLTVFVLTQVLWAADASPDYFEVWFFLD